MDNNENASLHPTVIQCMSEVDYDISSRTRKQLNIEMVNKADKIIVMTHKKNLPSYVTMSKVTFWNIENPKDTPLEFHRKVRDQIDNLVQQLLKEI